MLAEVMPLEGAGMLTPTPLPRLGHQPQACGPGNTLLQQNIKMEGSWTPDSVDTT